MFEDAVENLLESYGPVIDLTNFIDGYQITSDVLRLVILLAGGSLIYTQNFSVKVKNYETLIINDRRPKSEDLFDE